MENHGLGHTYSFPETQWSRIAASGDDRQSGKEALEHLARDYWRPICRFLERALDRSPDDARDLTQDFFAWIIESGFLSKADRERGRFRAFLKTALKHYVADADRRRRTQKRGGDRKVLALELPSDESMSALPADHAALPPERLLDEAWRARAVQLAISRLEEELRSSGRALMFEVFRDYFLDPSDDVDYGRLAAKHDIKNSDVSNWLQRAKKLYREKLEGVIAETVSDARELEAEMRWMTGSES